MVFVNLLTFLGRLHPLVVHLPIGILLLSLVLDLLSRRKGKEHLQSAVTLTLLLGSLSAILACVLGYLLSLSGDYGFRALNNHKVSGIVVAALSTLLYLLATNKYKPVQVQYPNLFTVLLCVMGGTLAYAGHQGGQLTHGDEYLSIEVLAKQKRKKPERIEDAYIFEDVVHPILEKRCSQCHQGGKEKGNLSIASLETLLKGGKHGPAIVPGKPLESEMIKRVNLSEDDEDFMPSDGKTPLTKGEKEIIHWWVEHAMAANDQKLTALEGHNKILPQAKTFLKLEGGVTDAMGSVASVNPAIPRKMDVKVVEELRAKGVIVRVMLQEPAMLDITITPESKVRVADVERQLRAVSKNIIWFNASGTGTTEKELDVIKEFANIEKLRLEKNPIGDGIIEFMMDLKYLTAINLYGTNISDEGVKQLKKNSAIKRIYLWGSKATGME